MKTLILLFAASMMLVVASPAMADDNKPRIGGVNTDKRAHSAGRDHRSSQRQTRGTRDHGQRQARGTRDRDQRQARGTRDRDQHHGRQGNQRWRGYLHHSYAGHNRARYRNYAHPRHSNHYRRSHYRGRYHDDRFGYLVGGVVLGALLTNADRYYDDYPRRRATVVRVVRNGSYGRRDDVHLFRDRYGDCFEIRRNRYGDEVREEIDPEYCDW